MKNKKLIRFVESFILVPALTISGAPIPSMGSISQAVTNVVNTPLSVLSQKQNNDTVRSMSSQGDSSVLVLERVASDEVESQKAKARAIDAYFSARNMPLEGQGMKMVIEAEKNDLDWRLLPAIAVRESSGGKNACDKVENSFFGWGSCKISFSSNGEAIEVVAKNLGGNNPKTAHHYNEKTTKQILRAYNPPSIVPRYAEQVISIMNDIGEEDEITGFDLLAMANK